MYCSKCGNKLVQEDQFCSSCGKSLTNIYNEEPHQPEVTDEKALEKFVGHNTNFYFSKWGIDTGDVKKVSPNLAAFFLGLFWVTYRKMYGLLIAIFIIFLAIDLLVYSTGAEYLNYFAGIFLSFILACFGNYFYYTHAKIKIEKIRRKNPSDLLKEVEKAGGTSYLSFFILLICFIIYAFLTIMISDVFFPEESKIEFGYDEKNGEIIELSDTYQPLDTIYYSFYFSDLKGGKFKVVIEKIEGNTQFIYESWEDEVPPDWEGVYNSIIAPDEVGIYEMKIIKGDNVSARGTFYISN